jgi:hypothetical protein
VAVGVMMFVGRHVEIERLRRNWQVAVEVEAAAE